MTILLMVVTKFNSKIASDLQASYPGFPAAVRKRYYGEGERPTADLKKRSMRSPAMSDASDDRPNPSVPSPQRQADTLCGCVITPLNLAPFQHLQAGRAGCFSRGRNRVASCEGAWSLGAAVPGALR